MAETGPWLTGLDLTAVTIAAITLAADGEITAATPKVLTHVVLQCGGDLTIQADDIRPVNSRQINEVPHSQGDNLRLVCLERSVLPNTPVANDDSANVLQTLVRSTASKRFLIAWDQGDEEFSGYYTLRGLTYGVTNRGQNTIEATFGPMDPGTTLAVPVPQMTVS
jgi:hypothetical protein